MKNDREASDCLTDYPVCPNCGSDRVQTDYADEGMWRCMDCDYRFPKESKVDFTSDDNWENEEEEIDGGIAEDLWGDE